MRENMQEVSQACQRALWENQHATRGAKELTDASRFVPNEAAVELCKYLPPHAVVLEVGSANGRDARYWASLGHRVIAMDFSQEALKQLQKISREQGVSSRTNPLVCDASTGRFPLCGKHLIDAFYARSALHVNDETMLSLACHVNELLKPGGVILIEGKGVRDVKIARSEKCKGHIAIDHQEHGHLRRIWTKTYMRALCRTFGWKVEQIADVSEVWEGTTAHFVRMVARKV